MRECVSARMRESLDVLVSFVIFAGRDDDSKDTNLKHEMFDHFLDSLSDYTAEVPQICAPGFRLLGLRSCIQPAMLALAFPFNRPSLSSPFDCDFTSVL